MRRLVIGIGANVLSEPRYMLVYDSLVQALRIDSRVISFENYQGMTIAALMGIEFERRAADRTGKTDNDRDGNDFPSKNACWNDSQ
jgi:hypothetical protein